LKELSVGIIGAGLSGLVCGSELSRHGFKVELFDKGRFAGGRLASRDRDEFTFDYGAQYFTAKDPVFRRFLAPLVRKGTVARWRGNFARLEDGELKQVKPHGARYVGVPLMRSLAEYLARDLNCRMSHLVTSVSHSNNRWKINGTIKTDAIERNFCLGPFDILVLNMPARQAANLLPHPRLAQVEMLPCLALQVAYPNRIDIEFDGISLDDEIISWVARDSSKPSRLGGERWVIHASPGWSTDNFGNTAESLEAKLLERFETIFGITSEKPEFSKLQKWKFALPHKTLEIDCIDEGGTLFYCGDWCLGSRVECAFLSGLATAEQIMLVQEN